jgi:hypothetical protein
LIPQRSAYTRAKAAGLQVVRRAHPELSAHSRAPGYRYRNIQKQANNRSSRAVVIPTTRAAAWLVLQQSALSTIRCSCRCHMSRWQNIRIQPRLLLTYCSLLKQSPRQRGNGRRLKNATVMISVAAATMPSTMFSRGSSSRREPSFGTWRPVQDGSGLGASARCSSLAQCAKLAV